MYDFGKKCLIGVLFTFLLAACTTTIVRGKKMVTMPVEPVDKIALFFQIGGGFKEINNDGKYVGSAALAGNRQVSSLFPHLIHRVPMVFALNGIENIAANGVSINGTLPPEFKNYREILQIIPQSASSGSGGPSLVVGFHLFNREKKLEIWSGSILLAKSIAEFDEATADELSRKLLLQLNKDGMIKLADTDIKIPKSSP
jgi:hypothetical protein